MRGPYGVHSRRVQKDVLDVYLNQVGDATTNFEFSANCRFSEPAVIVIKVGGPSSTRYLREAPIPQKEIHIVMCQSRCDPQSRVLPKLLGDTKAILRVKHYM